MDVPDRRPTALQILYYIEKYNTEIIKYNI